MSDEQKDTGQKGNEKLRRIRFEHGLTQAKLANELNVSMVTVNRWEQGVTQPSAYYQHLLCTLFKVSAEELGLRAQRRKRASSTGLKTEEQPVPVVSRNASIPFAQRSLSGRSDLLDSMLTQIEGGKGAFALSGLPGVGKTALGIAVAQHMRMQSSFPDGIYWISLGEQPHCFYIMKQLALKLGIPAEGIEQYSSVPALAAVLHEYIGERRLLFIIDDAWKFEDAQAFRLGSPQCAYLLTTRFPPIAHAFARKRAIIVNELALDASLQLLQQLAPLLPLEDLTTAQKLVERVGGLPLAIQLIGHHLDIQSRSGQPRRVSTALTNLYENIEKRLRLAEPSVPWEEGTTRPPGSAISLQTTIEISDLALSADARAALRALSVLPAKPAHFAEEFAQAVSNQPLHVLDQLVDHGLLESYQPGRYQIHQTIADYASFFRIESGVEQRFVSFAVEFAQKEQRDKERIELELITLLAALEIAQAQKMEEEIVECIMALGSFMNENSYYDITDIWFPRALESAQRLNDYEAQMQLFLYIGQSLEHRGSFVEAEQTYMQGIPLAEQHQSPLLAQLLIRTGGVIGDAVEYSRCLPYLERGAEVAQADKDYEMLCLALRYQGETADNLGNYAQARELYERGLSVATRTEKWSLASAFLQDLGVQCVRRGDYEQAKSYYERGLAYAQQIEDIKRQSGLLMNLGMLALHQKDYAEARTRSNESLKIGRRLHLRVRTCSVLQNLGIIERTEGNVEEAERYFQESMQLALGMKQRWLINETRGEWALLVLQQQRNEEARNMFQLMLSETQAIEAQQLIAQAYFGLAKAEMAMGQVDKAREAGQESLTIFQRLEDNTQLEVAEWLETHQLF